MRSLVLGGSGIVGGHIINQLVRAGTRPIALSRARREDTVDIEWFEGDLAAPQALRLPPFTTVYCTAHVKLLASALVHLSEQAGGTPTRVVAFTSTSIATKMD
jgi:nucleoside-diphosphate-sugar epimerase